MTRFLGFSPGVDSPSPGELRERWVSASLQPSLRPSIGPQKLVNLDGQGIGQFLDIVDGDVARPALDVRYEGSVQFRFQRQIFLRHLSLRAQAPQLARQNLSRQMLPWGRGKRGHAGNGCRKPLVNQPRLSHNR
jgi:hypothetical protein